MTQGGDDPERLIAQALRAHAARTPLPEATDRHTAGQPLGGFGLLSGSDVASPLPTPDAGTATDESALTSRLPAEPRVPVALVLLLAVLLGLAAGAVVGLLTLV